MANSIDQSPSLPEAPRPAALAIAAEHGVDIRNVVPPSKSERLAELRSTLDRKDVPHPIGPATAEAYFAAAKSGQPFGIGSLSNQTVDLAQYKNQQVYESFTFEDHLSWACLVADQQATKHQYACREYLEGEELFQIGGNVIPDYYILNARIFQQTGWQLATVSEIIPAEYFFHCHSRRFFPVTTFMRPLGTDYLAEPDIGHDVAGHVATFTIAQVAQVMNNHGLANDLIHHEKELKLKLATSEADVERIKAEATELLLYAGRLYWFTVEFGLVLEEKNLRAFGAGILSSPGETTYSIDSPDSNRILIDPAEDRDLLRLATTDYLISEFQKTYFVMKDFESLTSLTPQRILNVAHTAQKLPHHTWREIAPGDDVINVGKLVASPNEKYYRLLANQPMDECLRRAAIRNLRLFAQGLHMDLDVEKGFLNALPPIPQKLIEQFSAADQRGEFNSPVDAAGE
jgi:phenylalanine-4-hydroxylase